MSSTGKARASKGMSNVSVEHVAHPEDDQPHQSTDDPLAEITAAVGKQLDANNAILLKKIEEKSELTIKDAIKRALEKGWTGSSKKQKKDPEFKSKGNKIRYEVNQDILGKIETAIDAIDDNDLAAAKTELESGKSLINKQQKLIRIADREEHGWEVVKCYLSDDLADDTDDEKELARARKAALASITKRKAKSKLPFRNAPPYRSHNQSTQEYFARRDFTPSRGSYSNKLGYERRKSLCYKCGKEGHFQYNCPLKFGR